MIEFLEDVHVYLNEDGIIIPSVSELIRFKFPDMYKGVSEKVLKQKASYGTMVHDCIERFARGELKPEEIEDEDVRKAVENFEIQRKGWAFYIKDMEQIVSYKSRYAGKYDIRTEDDMLIDIKTTSALHEDWLAWQLGFYYLASGIDKDFGFVIWLPKKKKAQVRQINCVPKEELLQLLDEYEEHTSKGELLL